MAQKVHVRLFFLFPFILSLFSFFFLSLSLLCCFFSPSAVQSTNDWWCGGRANKKVSCRRGRSTWLKPNQLRDKESRRLHCSAVSVGKSLYWWANSPSHLRLFCGGLLLSCYFKLFFRARQGTWTIVSFIIWFYVQSKQWLQFYAFLVSSRVRKYGFKFCKTV